MMPKGNKGKDGYSEVGEKKTSILGYLFLTALFVFLIVIGQTIYSDIGRILSRPVQPAACALVYMGSLESVSRKPTCYFSDIDRKFGLEELIKPMEEDLARLADLNQRIASHRQRIRGNEKGIDGLLKKYDVSLQEVMAGQEAVFDQPGIRDRIRTMMEENESLGVQVEGLTVERDAVMDGMRPGAARLRSAHGEAMDFYRRQAAFYNLYRFLLKLLFILPLFAVSAFLYLRYKKRDSPYTIILTPIFFAVTILLLQIVLVFLYDILPKEWLTRVFRILMGMAALKYVIYYLVVAVVVILLGGVVYIIQKKVYAPHRVAARHLRKGRCPHCSLPIGLSEYHCPGCGGKIREDCPSCGRQRYAALPYCPSCGQTSTSDPEN